MRKWRTKLGNGEGERENGERIRKWRKIRKWRERENGEEIESE